MAERDETKQNTTKKLRLLAIYILLHVSTAGLLTRQDNSVVQLAEVFAVTGQTGATDVDVVSTPSADVVSTASADVVSTASADAVGTTSADALGTTSADVPETTADLAATTAPAIVEETSAAEIKPPPITTHDPPLMTSDGNVLTSSETDLTSVEATTEADGDLGSTHASAPTEDSGATDGTTECPDGLFGPWCDYVCFCRNVTEACNKIDGYCRSGCPDNYYGPGCLLDELPEELSIVAALATLLGVCVLVLGLLGFYTCIKQPRLLAKRQQHAMRAEEAAYDFRDMETRTDNYGVPVVELKRSIPRISEVDIQVMSDILAEGRFGEIYRGKLRSNGKQIEVAFKTIKPGINEDEKHAFVGQLELYTSIEEHPNVLKFYGVCAVGDQVYAAFEYTPHGNLRNFLRRNSMPEGQSELDDAESEVFSSRGRLLQFAYDAALGLRHLGRKRVVHRELSGSSILVGPDYVAKIGGLNVLGGTGKTKPVRWMAPESLLKAEFTVQSDIWSFGVLLWEIMTLGGKPYSDMAVKDIPGALEDGLRLSRPEGCGDELFGLMQWCWAENPEDRPSILKVSNSMKELVENTNLVDNLDSDIEDSV